MIKGYEAQFVNNHDGLRCRIGATGEHLFGIADASVLVPLIEGIPRFISASNSADSFGEQWHRCAEVQIDSLTGVDISRRRFFECSGWSPEELASKTVLEVGCGAGRFTEVLGMSRRKAVSGVGQ
jgi:hypothetical protein